MKPLSIAVVLSISAALSACSANTTLSGGQQPMYGPVIPQGSVALSTNNIYSFEAIAAGAVAIGLVYIIYDPLAPNWKVEEKALSATTYYISMRAKSFRTGGDGEPLMIVKRRALQLQRENGYTGYRVLDYAEGVESSTPFTHRTSEATIQLVRAEAAPKSP